MTLKSKKALITGSTSGIGLGIARQLAKAGCDIMISGHRHTEEEDKLVHEMAETYGVNVFLQCGDMTSPDFCEELVKVSAEKLGGLDILVNNAGMQFVAPVTEFPKEKWDMVIALNLSAVFHCTKRALPYMRQGNFGRILNIASAHGLVASPGKSAYVAAKHGVVGMTKVVALETAQENITANAICPGWVLTPLVEQQIKDNAEKNGQDFETAKKELLAEKQPSIEFVAPEQLGDYAVFLCSDSAAQITGAALPMDGGWTAR